MIELFGALDVLPVTTGLVLSAVDLHRLEPVSFWDALVVRAAQQAGCETLYSEDLQAGRHYGALRVVNPFA